LRGARAILSILVPVSYDCQKLIEKRLLSAPRLLSEPPKYLTDHILLSLLFFASRSLSRLFSYLSHFFSSLSICYSPTQSWRTGGISAWGMPCTSSLRSATSARFASNSSFISIGALCSRFYSMLDPAGTDSLTQSLNSLSRMQ
jgi:hypothetical protein